MSTLFNSGSEPSADEPLRPVSTARTEPAGVQEEPVLFASSASRYAAAAAEKATPPEKEITLSTMTVLGIFFALAVLCAGFFAFGYSSGSKHGSRPGSGAAITDASSTPGCKPAPGSMVAVGAPIASVAPMNVPYSQPAARPVAAGSTPMTGTIAATQTQPAVPVPEHAAARTPPVAVPVSAPPAAPAGQQQPTMVQVAALSHQADAEMVASALKGRGYSVAIHPSSSDALMHVQLGPFATRKEAEAMRQRLLGDGFNAILK